jgi:hypothetical protein
MHAVVFRPPAGQRHHPRPAAGNASGALRVCHHPGSHPGEPIRQESIIDPERGRFKWNPPLVIGRAAKQRITATPDDGLKACRTGGYPVVDDRRSLEAQSYRAARSEPGAARKNTPSRCTHGEALSVVRTIQTIQTSQKGSSQ